MKLLICLLPAVLLVAVWASPHHQFVQHSQVGTTQGFGNNVARIYYGAPQFLYPARIHTWQVRGNPQIAGQTVMAAATPAQPSRSGSDFCKMVGQSLANSPEDLSDEDSLPDIMLDLQQLRVKPDGRQHVGPLNLGYLCRRISRLPIPGDINPHRLARYCKRIAHAITNNLFGLLRQELATPGGAQTDLITGVSGDNYPHDVTQSDEAVKIANLCDAMLDEIKKESLKPEKDEAAPPAPILVVEPTPASEDQKRGQPVVLLHPLRAGAFGNPPIPTVWLHQGIVHPYQPFVVHRSTTY